MGPSRAGASIAVTKMAVGPSAPPIIPTEDDSAPLKPMRRQPMKVMKMPSCAAAPSSKLLGLAIRGPKSVIAPTPMKMRQG